MTEEIKPESEQQVSPGATLKQARLSAGLSLNDLATKLYVKPAEIEAIENDLLDSNKSRTFIKGYVKNYARAVGLNVVELSHAFDAYHKSGDTQPDSAKLQSFSKRVAKEANDNRWMMVTYFILLLFIGGFVLWYMQQPDLSFSQAADSADDNQTQEQEPPEEAPDFGEPESAFLQSTTLPSESVDLDGVIPERSATESNISDKEATSLLENSVSGEMASAEENKISASTALEPEQESETNTTQNLRTVDIQPIDASNLSEPVEPQDTITSTVSVVFTFEEDCWVNIVDASGEAIAYGVKKAGRVMDIQGVPPFNITLGLPQVVRIVYDGEEVDMSGFSGREIGKLVLPPQG
jgi:cytoskeleton protein RodZ